MVRSNSNLNNTTKIPFNTPLALLGFVFLLISSASAQVLTREVAAKPIAEYEQVRVREVTVGPLLKVEKRSKKRCDDDKWNSGEIHRYQGREFPSPPYRLRDDLPS